MDLARRFPIKRKIFISHFLAVFLVSGSIGTFFYLSAMSSLMNNLKSRLMNSAALVSQVIDARDIREIRAPKDVSLPAYQNNLTRLRALRRTNPDLAFLYIMRLDGEKIFFVIDSDETDAQALPGRQYDEIPPAMISGFTYPSVDDKIYTDEWGSFLSGYSPLPNGGGRYLVGMDMRADEVNGKLRKMRISGIVSLISSVILAVFLSQLLGSNIVKRIELLTLQCRAIAEGQIGDRLNYKEGDELDKLIMAFNTMSEKLGVSQDENRKARIDLEQARDELEARVKERTRDLRKLNETLTKEASERKQAVEQKEALISELRAAMAQVKTLRGLLPTCTSCKKIRDDKGYWTQIEAYISEHSDAEFSHSICPDCAEKLYPGLYSKNK